MILSILLAASLSAKDPRFELETVQKDLALEKVALERLKLQASSVLEELDSQEQAVVEARTAAHTAEAAAAAAAARVKAAEGRERDARRRLDALFEELSPRLLVRYRLSRRGREDLLATSRSAGEWVRRARMLDAILGRDLEDFSAAKVLLDELSSTRVELDRERQVLAQASDSATARKAELSSRRQALKRLREAVLAEANMRERAVRELGKAQDRLKALVASLRNDPFLGTGFGALRGKLPYPTAGRIEVGFGRIVNPKFNTVTVQKGVDLRAPEGLDVVAVAPGKVMHAGWFRGYGNLLIVDHGEGFYTLAAHLKSIDRLVGDSVQGGEVVGQVGDTGSLKGAYLYFEIRHRGKPVDPTEWLGPASKRR